MIFVLYRLLVWNTRYMHILLIKLNNLNFKNIILSQEISRIKIYYKSINNILNYDYILIINVAYNYMESKDSKIEISKVK